MSISQLEIRVERPRRMQPITDLTLITKEVEEEEDILSILRVKLLREYIRRASHRSLQAHPK